MTGGRVAFAGAVLVGGASRRMGTDKAFVEVEGRSLAERALAAMRRAGAVEVLSIGGDDAARRRLAAMGYRAVADERPGEGPLAGIVTALGAAEASPVLVWAVDQPWCGGDALTVLVRGWADGDRDVLALAVDQQGPDRAPAARRQVLAALYDRRCRARLAAALHGGERSVERAVRELAVDEIRFAATSEMGDLWDLDSPEDLRRYAATTVRPGAATGAATPYDPPSHPGGPGERRPPERAGGPSVNEAVPEIDITTLVSARADGASVIDVREPHEYVAGHVPGARLVPMGEVPDRVGELPTGAPVYLICHSGGRSRRAAQFLRAQGIDAINVAGGTAAWIESSHPVVTGDEPG